jgi:TolA-binding protein
MIKLFPLILVLIFSSACLKTTEQIEREQKVDTLEEVVDQSTKNVADLRLELKSIKEKMATLNGEMEEIKHHSEKSNAKGNEELKKQNSNLEQVVNQLSTDNKNLHEKVNLLTTELTEIKEFIKKVTSHLEEKTVSKNQDEVSYDKATGLLESKKIKKAKEMFLNIIADPNQEAKYINKSNLQLGIIEYKSKNFDESLVYLSKVYTQYPESSSAPTALFYIGKALRAQKKKAEAKASFDELIEKFPESKEAKDAKLELKK